MWVFCNFLGSLIFWGKPTVSQTDMSCSTTSQEENKKATLHATSVYNTSGTNFFEETMNQMSY